MLAMQEFRSFLSLVTVLPLNRRIMQEFASIRGGLPRPIRQQVVDLDLLIAATALHHGLTLVTRNVKDYQLVPGVVLYQP